MPELSRFKGIVIKMYYDDVSQHYKPHVHVFYERAKRQQSASMEKCCRASCHLAPVPNR